MYCYNCGKQITDKSKATSLDDLNWSHDVCLYELPKEHNTITCSHGKGLACPVCYNQSHSWEDSEFVVDPFDTYEEGELPSKSSCITPSKPMRIQTELFMLNPELGCLHPWQLWFTEDSPSPFARIECYYFSTNPTKRQIRKYRRIFDKSFKPLNDHEEIVISVLGME